MRDDAISVSLGLEGFTVLDTIEADDRVDVLIELKTGAGVCPGCGGVSTSISGGLRSSSTACRAYDGQQTENWHPEVNPKARGTERARALGYLAFVALRLIEIPTCKSAWRLWTK